MLKIDLFLCVITLFKSPSHVLSHHNQLYTNDDYQTCEVMIDSIFVYANTVPQVGETGSKTSQIVSGQNRIKIDEMKKQEGFSGTSFIQKPRYKKDRSE